MIGRLIRFIIGGFVLTSIGAAIAAMVVKQRTPSIGAADSDEIAQVAIFEPLSFESTASAFRGGSLLCMYGGGDVDLRKATLDPAGAHLTIRTIFGGARLLVPDEWIVDMNVIGILGGVGDARPARERPADAPRLTIDGIAFFGGLGVDSLKRENEIDIEVMPLPEPEPLAALEV
jgi:predicted membrane protein